MFKKFWCLVALFIFSSEAGMANFTAPVPYARRGGDLIHIIVPEYTGSVTFSLSVCILIDKNGQPYKVYLDDERLNKKDNALISSAIWKWRFSPPWVKWNSGPSKGFGFNNEGLTVIIFMDLDGKKHAVTEINCSP